MSLQFCGEEEVQSGYSGIDRRYLVIGSKYLPVHQSLYGDVLLAVEESSVSKSIGDSIRDGGHTRVRRVRAYYWAQDMDELKDELARLGGEYNPRT